MRVSDKLWTPEDAGKLWTPYEGHLKLELFDADTGKLQERVEADNYATDFLMNSFKWFARRYWTYRCGFSTPTNSSSNDGYAEWTGFPPQSSISWGGTPYNDPGPNTGPGYVLLTNATHAEDPTNDRYIRGSWIAWASNEGFTGTDSRRGSANNIESVIANNKCVFVIDWPTNSGNGTMQSVYWCYINFTSNAINYITELYMNAVAPAVGYGSTWTSPQASGISGYGNSPPERGLWLDPDGVSYWTIYSRVTPSAGSTLIKRTIGSGAVVNQITLNTISAYCWGFTNDGVGTVGNWWAVDMSNSTLYKFPAAGGNPTGTYTFASLGIPNFSSTNNTYSGVMFFYNGYIWMGSTTGTTPYVMRQILASGPTVAATLSLTTNPYSAGNAFSNYSGCYYPDSVNGDELWLSGSGNTISRFDLSGNLRGVWYPAPVIPMLGLALYGTGIIINYSYYSGVSPYFMQIGYVSNNNRCFGARSLLPSPVTKSNTQTMKLTYEFDYS